MTILATLLFLLTLLVWMTFLANASSQHDSDAAGNAMSQGFAVISGIVLWMLLAVLLVLTWFRGGMPLWSVLAAAILLPFAGFAALRTVQMMARYDHPGNWPLVVPAGVPLLVLAWCAWAWFPSLRAHVSPALAGGALWGCVLVLALLPWPAIVKYSRIAAQRQAELARYWGEQAEQERQQRRQELLAHFAKVPPDAHLWQWAEFTRDDDDVRRQALAGARRQPTRQADAQLMLDKDINFPMAELPNLDLQATPELCRSARAFLQKRAQQISPPVPGRPYDWEKNSIDPYLPAMEWLLAHGCDCSAEVTAAAAAVRAYPRATDRDQTLATLARLRPPR
jgi:membrane protein YdbS with pleckstrin-like domain